MKTRHTKNMLLWYFILFIAELILLSLLSDWFTKYVYALFLLIVRMRSVAVSFITLLLFPGTVIHELSHLFTAEILGVRTGKLTLVPESIEEKEMRSGSVMIAKTDPFRRAVIGLAPLFVGIAALVGLSWVLPNLWNETAIAFQQKNLFSSSSFYFLLLTFYFVSAISVTMFASKEDMKGVWPLFFVLLLLSSAAYLAGIRVGLTIETMTRIESVLLTLIRSIGLVIAINVVGLLPIKFLVDHQTKRR